MAEAKGQLYFDRLTGGMMKDADRLTIGPDTYPTLWADLKNLVAYKGRLQRREGFDASFVGPVAPGAAAADYPILITSVLVGAELERFIVVTTRDLWIGSAAAGWVLITPTYAAGTIAVLNGNASITGTGTAWVDRRIMPGQPIKIGGTWYTLATVSSNTAATLSVVYGGGDDAAIAYEIRRTFSGDILRPFAACRVLNGDAYLVIANGGYYQNPTSMAIVGGTAVVLRVAGAAAADIAPTAAATTILLSTDAMEVGTDNYDAIIMPKGLELLEDGRLVIPAHIQTKLGVTPVTFINNRVLFSSHLDLSVWTTPPGGFYDLIGGRGGITASGRIAGAIAVHFTDQVQVGQITGADVDPISWRTTRAHVGAAGPRLLVDIPPSEATPGGQFFLAGDANTYVFDGDRSIPVRTGWDAMIRDSGGFWMSTIATEGHLSFDELRRAVSLFSTLGPLPSVASQERRYDIDTGIASRQQYKNLISAANQQRHVTVWPGAMYGRLFGVRGTTSTGTATNYVYTASYDVLNDTALPLGTAGQLTGGFLAETHDLRLGAVDLENSVERIVLWFHGRAAVTETIKCSISVDSGVAWTLGVGSNAIVLANTVAERRVAFFFEAAPPADRVRIRIEGNSDDVFSYALTRMLIDYATVANIRAVA